MRTTNLIQSYINNNHPKTQQYNSDKASKDFDVHKELSNRTFIKPLPSNGKLVRNTIMDYPSQVQKDIKYDIKAIYHAIKGDANDHELGRINDVAMKFGGLALAAFLFTKKQTPKTKLFEFIGLGTFFAAMDIWPKLFIQLPAKLIHGVNVRQEYEDNYGRKKMFYQDHQFIPWDLYSDDEINKIGDKLNVPKDIPNRRNFIQEKMRKVALQNNTLWMLTAGVATPLMSALLCNALEKPVGKLTANAVDKSAEKYITNFAEEVKKIDMSKNEKALEDMLSANAGKPMTPELLSSIAANLSEGLDRTVAVSIGKDLADLFPVNQSFKITDDNIEKIQDTIRDVMKKSKISEDVVQRIIPDADKIREGFSTRGLLNGEYKEFSEHTKLIQNLIDENIKNISNDLDSKTVTRLNFVVKKLVHSPEFKSDGPLFGSLKLNPAAILTEGNIKLIKKISEILNVHKPEEMVLNKAAFLKVAQAPETSLANIWNDTASEIFKALNFTSEEIKNARLDNELTDEILRGKIEDLVSSKENYSKFIEKMEKLLSSLHTKTSMLDMAQDDNTNSLKALINTTYDRTAYSLLEKGMDHTASSIGGIVKVLSKRDKEELRENPSLFGRVVSVSGENGQVDSKVIISDSSSAKRIMIDFITQRVNGVKNSFYRFLNLTDMYYRMAHIQDNHPILTNRIPREIKEEMVELAKAVMIDGHTSDFVVKFWQKRNPIPNKTDFSQIETANGRVQNKYLGKYEHEAVEYANDRKFYEGVMKLLYGEDIHPDTYEKIKNSGFLEEFRRYRKDFLEIFGGYDYFPKPNFKVNDKEVKSTSIRQFILNGCTPTEMANKAFNNMFNSNKWFSMFGKLGIGLVGVTLLSQFFIGRMKAPKINKEVQQ